MIGQNTWPLSLCLYSLLGLLNLTPNLALGRSLNILPQKSLNLETLLTTCGQVQKHKWFFNKINQAICLGSDLDDNEDDEDDGNDDHDDNPDH